MGCVRKTNAIKTFADAL